MSSQIRYNRPIRSFFSEFIYQSLASYTPKNYHSMRASIFPRLVKIGLFFFLATALFAQVVPQSTVHSQQMSAVQKWLEEDIALAEKSMLPEIAATRRADLVALNSNAPVESPPAAHVDLLPPIPRLVGNPVMKGFYQDLQTKILTPDQQFLKGKEGGKARSPEGWFFIVRANELMNLTQAFCHPQSPLAGDPALVAPILRRLAIFSEYMVVGGPVLGDFGPCGTVADAWLILSSCRPEIIPPSLREGLNQGIRNNADLILTKRPEWSTPPSAATPCLVNADVNLVLAVAIANRLLPSPTYAAGVKAGLAYLEPHILPDGATNYIGQQNECAGYHGTAVRSLARIAQITGETQPLEMVRRLRWYYPLVASSTGVMEWATATSWHHYWNTSNGAESAAIIAGLTNCPQNQRVANLGYKGDLWQASYWNPDRAAADFPDHYLTYDRNGEGPRARYGAWSTVGTTRKTNDNRGKSSYVGCVLETGKPGTWQLDSALQDAGMEIRLDSKKDTDTEHRGRITLAHEEPITTSAVGEHAAALGAVARLGAYGQPATSWITRQAWLFTPERMVGLVTLEAGADLQAAGLYGCLYLVSGRASWGERKELQDLGRGNFAYGALNVTFHGHDFSGFDHEYSDVMGGGLNASSSQKSCRLLLVDDAAKSGITTAYAKGASHYYLVELRPASSTSAKITREIDAKGLLSFQVQDGTGDYRVVFNPTDTAADLILDPSKILHRSGEKFRAPWLKEAGPVDTVAPIPAPASYSLPSGEIIFLSER